MVNIVTLRPYQPRDLEAIFRLDQACFDQTFRFDRSSMRRFAQAPNALALIAEIASGEIAGFVIVHLEREAETTTGYVVTLDVAPDRRRSGIANLLMTHAEDRARNAGASSMTLHAYTANGSALRFYEQRGYQRLGTEPRFYGSKDGVDLDAALYGKQLQPG